MKDQGWNIDVDGFYGPQSKSIASQFQQKEGLVVDGIVGVQTWEATFDTDAQAPTSPPSPPPSSPPTSPPPPPPTTGSTSYKDKVVRIATEQWQFFKEGASKEGDDGAWQRVVLYWQSLGRTDINTPAEVESENNPWSAAFISWVMREAGVGDKFEYNASHSYYIYDAVQDRRRNDSNAAFFAYELSEYSPKPGDLIGHRRGNDDDVNINTQPPYVSHVDIVVATRPGEIDVIGGNVSDSVTRKRSLTVDPQGRLIDRSSPWFVVLENRMDAQAPQAPTSPPSPPPTTGSTSYDVTKIINSNAVESSIRTYAQESVPLILSKAKESGITDPGQIAYILASADHESLLGKLMLELASGEAYEGREDLGNTQPGDGPRFKGRGYVQITGRNNYKYWSEKLGIDLVSNPDLATKPDIAATILVLGMRDGNYTSKKLSDYINGDKRDFVNARRIVNGDVEKNGSTIAQDAERYYKVLTA